MILVTGATGTTGSALLDELLGRGQEVTAVTREPSRIEPRDGLTVSTDIVAADALYLVAPAGPGIPEHDRRNLEAAQPAVRELESEAEQGYTADEITITKSWLVSTGQRLEHVAQSRPA